MNLHTKLDLTILPSELFGNLLNRIRKADKDAKDQAEKDGKEVDIADLDENLNEILQTNFKNIEASAIGSPSEENFKGLFDDIDVNSNKLGPTVIKRNKRLKRLITVIGDMDLGNYQDNSIDAFGDTYEYLMGMYASNAGKSGGEFFTPQEVSELLTKISLLGNNGKMKTEVNKVYDPAVGSGSLLLKFAKILGKDNVRNGFFGQEINITTYNLCRINMFLHDIGYDKFSIEHGDTLTDPKHWDEEPFGDMHKSITNHFKNYHIFGFTGTPIFASNSNSSNAPNMRTTAQVFGGEPDETEIK